MIAMTMAATTTKSEMTAKSAEVARSPGTAKAYDEFSSRLGGHSGTLAQASGLSSYPRKRDTEQWRSRWLRTMLSVTAGARIVSRSVSSALRFLPAT
jgi:hypothetical protein